MVWGGGGGGLGGGGWGGGGGGRRLKGLLSSPYRLRRPSLLPGGGGP